jgi:hypothetical protein
MRLPKLRKYMSVLQGYLGLINWTITLRWAVKSDEFCYGQQGQAVWSATTKEAEIIVKKGSDELHTLAHELLHVFLEGHTSERGVIKSIDQETYEGNLNHLANVLIKLMEAQGKV